MSESPESIEQILAGLSEEDLALRLGVELSQLQQLRLEPTFAHWSQKQDPQSVAWQYQKQQKRYIPCLGFS